MLRGRLAFISALHGYPLPALQQAQPEEKYPLRTRPNSARATGVCDFSLKKNAETLNPRPSTLQLNPKPCSCRAGWRRFCAGGWRLSRRCMATISLRRRGSKVRMRYPTVLEWARLGKALGRSEARLVRKRPLVGQSILSLYRGRRAPDDRPGGRVRKALLRWRRFCAGGWRLSRRCTATLSLLRRRSNLRMKHPLRRCPLVG